MKQIRTRLTYANVMSSIAVFLILGGATAFAAKKIGAKQLKPNSVTTAKLKKNAVTTAKIKAKAVTGAKLGDGSVNFAKIAAGTSLIANASGSIAATQGTFEELATIPLTGVTTFTPAAGVVDQVNVEVRGNLVQSGTEQCNATVVPYVNGNPWQVSNGFVSVSSAGKTPPPFAPNGFPLGGETGPVGLTSPGAPISLAAKLIGDAKDCAPDATVTAAIAVTQLK